MPRHVNLLRNYFADENRYRYRGQFKGQHGWLVHFQERYHGRWRDFVVKSANNDDPTINSVIKKEAKWLDVSI